MNSIILDVRRNNTLNAETEQTGKKWITFPNPMPFLEKFVVITYKTGKSMEKPQAGAAEVSNNSQMC